MQGPDEPADGVRRSQEPSLLAGSFAGSSWRLDLLSCTFMVNRTKLDPSPGKQEAATWCIIHLQSAAPNLLRWRKANSLKNCLLFLMGLEPGSQRAYISMLLISRGDEPLAAPVQQLPVRVCGVHPPLPKEASCGRASLICCSRTIKNAPKAAHLGISSTTSEASLWGQ